MKPATVHQIKHELKHCSHDQLLALCIRLANFKKDNKELLSYLLFESDNEGNFVQTIQSHIDELFANINYNSSYWTAKGLRKVIRYIDKISRYSGEKSTELDLRIYFCQQVRRHDLPVKRLKTFNSIYTRQLDKIDKAFSKVHEDERLDFMEAIEDIQL